jgi:glyoxylase-like metal-dependent hydrolase (beta-lactamase superfamily II)
MAKRVPGDEVSEGVGRIPGFVNAYVFEDASGTYLIDTTMNGRAKHVRQAFQRASRSLGEIGTVLLTHSHLDHVGGAASVAADSRAAVACHEEDAPAIDGRSPPKIPLIFRLFLRVRPVAVSRTLRDGESVGPLKVVFAPGHTVGEVAFYHPGRRLLFSGDAVVERKGRLTVPAPRYAADLRQALASLKILRDLPVETLLPGHGDPVRSDVAGRLDELIARAPREFLGE